MQFADLARLAQLQHQSIADHPVVAHDAFEHFAQAATGHDRQPQGVEGGGRDVTGGVQAQGRVAAGVEQRGNLVEPLRMAWHDD